MLRLFAFATFASLASADLFISEVAEGTSHNKYFEIYNPNPNDTNLNDYAFATVANAPTTAGEHENWNNFTEGKTIVEGGVYVVCHGSADDAIMAECDQQYNYLSNGDDGLCLVQGTEANYTLLDCVGDFNADPGSGWEVAGVADGTKDHTLVRKSNVTTGNIDWPTSAGTSADDSEWIVEDVGDWSNLGIHIMNSSDGGSGCTLAGDCTIDSSSDSDGKPDIHAVYKSWNGPFGTDDPTFTTDFYTGTGICCYDNDGGNGVGYNREHIWPQSRWPKDKDGVHSLFNLMPTEASENSKRSNKLFGGTGYTPYNGQTKGIVARVILNLAYRFANCNQADDACFDNMMNYLTNDAADAKKMGDYNVLAQWALDNQQDQQEKLHYNSMGGLTVADDVNTFADSTVLQSFMQYISVVPISVYQALLNENAQLTSENARLKLDCVNKTKPDDLREAYKNLQLC